MKNKIIVADDHTVLRAGLKLLLNSQEDMEVVGEASNGKEVIKLVGEIKPDIVLLDLTMPGMNGLEALEIIKKEQPNIKVLVLTMHDDEGYLKSVLQLGASGYITKKAADSELITALRVVAKGEVFIDPSLTKFLVQELFNPKKEDEQESKSILSKREEEVLRYVALGYTNQQIADTLYVSIKSVEKYKAKIKEKLNLKRRSDIVRYAMEHGYLPID